MAYSPKRVDSRACYRPLESHRTSLWYPCLPWAAPNRPTWSDTSWQDRASSLQHNPIYRRWMPKSLRRECGHFFSEILGPIAKPSSQGHWYCSPKSPWYYRRCAFPFNQKGSKATIPSAPWAWSIHRPLCYFLQWWYSNDYSPCSLLLDKCSDPTWPSRKPSSCP